jgi:hypothetical protein
MPLLVSTRINGLLYDTDEDTADHPAGPPFPVDPIRDEPSFRGMIES